MGLDAFVFIAYSPSSKMLSVEFELPSFTVAESNVNLISLNDFYLPLSEVEENRVRKGAMILKSFVDLNDPQPDIN